MTFKKKKNKNKEKFENFNRSIKQAVLLSAILDDLITISFTGTLFFISKRVFPQKFDRLSRWFVDYTTPKARWTVLKGNRICYWDNGPNYWKLGFAGIFCMWSIWGILKTGRDWINRIIAERAARQVKVLKDTIVETISDKDVQSGLDTLNAYRQFTLKEIGEALQGMLVEENALLVKNCDLSQFKELIAEQFGGSYFQSRQGQRQDGVFIEVKNPKCQADYSKEKPIAFRKNPAVKDGLPLFLSRLDVMQYDYQLMTSGESYFLNAERAGVGGLNGYGRLVGDKMKDKKNVSHAYGIVQNAFRARKAFDSKNSFTFYIPKNSVAEKKLSKYLSSSGTIDSIDVIYTTCDFGKNFDLKNISVLNYFFTASFLGKFFAKVRQIGSFVLTKFFSNNSFQKFFFEKKEFGILFCISKEAADTFNAENHVSTVIYKGYNDAFFPSVTLDKILHPLCKDSNLCDFSPIRLSEKIRSFKRAQINNELKQDIWVDGYANILKNYANILNSDDCQTFLRVNFSSQV